MIVRLGVLAALVAANSLIVPARQQFKSAAAAVRVDALVTDGRRPVARLTAADFELRDNGVLQTIGDVQYETLPVNVFCALDVSGSLNGEPLRQLTRAYVSVIDSLVSGDRAALISFANRMTLHSPLSSDWPQLKSLAANVRSGGATSLFDSFYGTLTVAEVGHGRTLVLLFSDGRDSSSWLTARQVLEAVRQSEVVIYPIAVKKAWVPPPRVGRARVINIDYAKEFLDALADESGGRVAYASDETALASTFLEVLSEFRQRYVLTYTPTGVSAAGWHTIEVKTRRRDLKVSARRGYAPR
jgi:VWFA-related protein